MESDYYNPLLHESVNFTWNWLIKSDRRRCDLKKNVNRVGSNWSATGRQGGAAAAIRVAAGGERGGIVVIKN